MLKAILYVLLAAGICGAIAGGWHLYRVAARNRKEMAPYQGPAESVTKNFGKTLVVYYSLSGNTRDIAEAIRKKTGADIYEIKTEEEFKNSPLLYLKLKKQLKDKKYPALAGKMPDFSAYDTVFVGAPVWWYTMATPMFAFLNQVDFDGRRVIPFSTQGSNYGRFFEDFDATAKNAKIVSSASFNNLSAEYDQAVDNKISRWLNGIDVVGN